MPSLSPPLREALQRGQVIPACPLALDADRRFDERRQRALARYYLAAGAGGLAVGVHTTQFAIRDPQHALLRPVLALVADELNRGRNDTPFLRVAGVCGDTAQAVREAELAVELGYHCGLVSLAALRACDDDALVTHCAAVGRVLPIMGFYLQPAVGGRALSYAFWRNFAELDAAVAVKIAPFNRYQTLDVVRAVIDSGRDDLALYTGNDDNIVADLVTPFRFERAGRILERRIVGGLLGQWAVGTRAAVRLLQECHTAQNAGAVPARLLAEGAALTAANAAIFDAANAFAGCVPGIHEVLRRQGLLEGVWCLDLGETLSPGQAEAIALAAREHPDLLDEAFVAEHRDAWLAG